MNLFWKKLFGGITPTVKLEQELNDLIFAMKRYVEVGKSVELEEYKKLFHVVKSAPFQANKKTLKNRKYKDTEFYQISKKHRKLENKSSIILYYEVLHSEDLKEYLSFKNTSDFEQLGNKKLVKESEKLRKLKDFDRSEKYKTYTRFHESYIITELEKIKIQVSKPEFKKENEFWANPKRWQTTPEYIQEERFYELSRNPDIVFYENEKPERFAKYRSLILSFQDEFDWNTLDKSRWNFGFHYKSPELIGNHSFANEKQANNSGKNVSVVDGILKISTKNEKTVARAWHKEKGFIEQEFDYTADVVQTADKFRQKHGVFSAKLRCTGNVNHAFWLGADSKLPFINIFHHNGKYLTMGNANKNVVDGVKIKGINFSNYYIYSLVWTEKELIWMINNYEVYRTTSNIPHDSMYLAFNSFISEKQHGSSGHLEVDWVRVYSN